MSRKRELRDRALKYAEHNATNLVDGAFGFQAGYRAALKDARRAIHRNIDVDCVLMQSEEGPVYQFPAIRKFLRPLR